MQEWIERLGELREEIAKTHDALGDRVWGPPALAQKVVWTRGGLDMAIDGLDRLIKGLEYFDREG